MNNHTKARIASYFHFAVGVVVLGSAACLGIFFEKQVEQQIISWWVYPTFAALVILILAINEIFFKEE